MSRDLIQDVLETTDYSLLTFYHGSWADDQAKHLKKSISRRVDGIIIVGAPEKPDGPNHRLIKQLQDRGMPIVQIYRRIFPNVPVVLMDDEQAGYLSTGHLLELGHRRIAHVTYSGYRDDLLPGIDEEAHRRCAGYLRAMYDAGIAPTVLTFERTGDPAQETKDYVPCCRQIAQQLATCSPRITGVTAFNDYAAIGLLHNLIGLGVRVPQDISIVGHDNTETGILMRPTLTTVAPKLFEIGRLAGSMILQMMDGGRVKDAVLAPELVVRGSSASPQA